MDESEFELFKLKPGYEIEPEKPRRVRRPTGIPVSVLELMEAKENHPHRHRIEFTSGDTEYCLRYRKTRWHNQGGESDLMTKRSIYAWIFHAKERIGALKFVEYKQTEAISNEDFLESMDMESQEDHDLGCDLVQRFKHIGEIASRGSIVKFDLAWMTPSYARAGIWVDAADTLTYYETMDYAMMIAIPSPIEYGHVVRGDSAFEAKQERTAAMVRYYGKMLGLKPMSDEGGRNFWLWKPGPLTSNDDSLWERPAEEPSAGPSL